jgi:hypothetical protein
VPKQRRRDKTTSAWEEPEEENNPAFHCIFQTRTGNSIRKSLPHAFPAPNPNFHCQYGTAKDAKVLHTNLVLGPDLSQDIGNRVIMFVQEFWDVFREEGVKMPIRGYEMVSNTGTHEPIAVQKPHCGLHEIPIMQKIIYKLLEMMFIRQDVTSPRASQITLAPKLHQEAVMDITGYIWRFCINYIRVNIVTRPAEYPIPRCGNAVVYGFGEATFFILLDAYSGYHQVKLSEASAIETALSAPHGRKYCCAVMPFGLRNCPVVFITMMHDLQELWIKMARKEGINFGLRNGTTIIIDNTFLFGVNTEASFVLARCVCLIARKCHLT